MLYVHAFSVLTLPASSLTRHLSLSLLNMPMFCIHSSVNEFNAGGMWVCACVIMLFAVQCFLYHGMFIMIQEISDFMWIAGLWQNCPNRHYSRCIHFNCLFYLSVCLSSSFSAKVQRTTLFAETSLLLSQMLLPLFLRIVKKLKTECDSVVLLYMPVLLVFLRRNIQVSFWGQFMMILEHIFSAPLLKFYHKWCRFLFFFKINIKISFWAVECIN